MAPLSGRKLTVAPEWTHRLIEGEIRKRIEELVGQLYDSRAAPDFVPGSTVIGYAGRVYDAEELVALVEASIDFWLTSGPRTEAFESQLAHAAGTKYALLLNSGSSANLAAISSLGSPKMRHPLRAGDEVITTAAAFPTTVNPILQNGWVPVFVDIELPTYNTTYERVAAAIGPRTRAVVLTHTMGNPFDAKKIGELCRARGLYLIEDCCDAFGATLGGKPVGTFGVAATLSFYPAHQMTTGEGGAVLTSSGRFQWIARSFRDWGRDCWCGPGEDDVCRKRFGFQLGTLPYGYDHKFIYAHIGYNLKALDLQAAVGTVQLRRLDTFVAARRRNWAAMRAHLARYSRWLVLPEHLQDAEPSPFGLVLTVRPDAPFDRRELTQHLEAARIQTRMLFAGNLLRHPAYEGVKYRSADDLSTTDLVTERTFFLGVYPGIDLLRRTYILQQFDLFFQRIGLHA